MVSDMNMPSASLHVMYILCITYNLDFFVNQPFSHHITTSCTAIPCSSSDCFHRGTYAVIQQHIVAHEQQNAVKRQCDRGKF